MQKETSAINYLERIGDPCKASSQTIQTFYRIVTTVFSRLWKDCLKPPWIGDIAAQEPSNRDRAAEFRVHGVEADVFRKRLADNLEYARNVLDKMSLQDLESMRVSPGNDREYTVAWALLHALEHATSHLGQIHITRQLWEQKGK